MQWYNKEWLGELLSKVSWEDLPEEMTLRPDPKEYTESDKDGGTWHVQRPRGRDYRKNERRPVQQSTSV